MTISELKKEARIKLSGKYLLSFGITLLHFLVTTILTVTAILINNIFGLLLAIANIFISIALDYGLMASLLKVSRDEKVSIIDFIKLGFKGFKKAFLLALSIFIRLIIPIILLVISIVLSNYDAYMLSQGEPTNGILSILSLIIMIVSIVFILYKSLSYTLTTFILIDNPETKTKDIISRSCKLMKGNKVNFIALIISFIGWIILSSLISSLASYYNFTISFVISILASLMLSPYITFAEINFYEDIIDSEEVTVKND